MVTAKGKTTKKKSAPKKASTSKTTTKRHKKSEASYIPGAMATAALVAVTAKPVTQLVKSATARGYDLNTVMGRFQTSGDTKAALKGVIGKNALVKDAIAIGGGYLAGEIVRKYAPSVIKKPIAKISKKIPRVIR